MEETVEVKVVRIISMSEGSRKAEVTGTLGKGQPIETFHVRKKKDGWFWKLPAEKDWFGDERPRFVPVNFKKKKK